MQNGTFIDGLAIKKMWFSMAMLNNQMVTNMIEHDSHVLPISHELPGNKGFQSRFLWTIADPSSLKMGYDELTILTILNIAWIDIFLIKYSADTYIYIYIHIWEIPYMNSRVQLSQLQTSQNSIRPSAVAQDGSLDLAELHTGRLSGDHGWPAGWSWGCGSKIIGKFPMIYGKHMENLWKFPKSRFSICFPYINGHATGT